MLELSASVWLVLQSSSDLQQAGALFGHVPLISSDLLVDRRQEKTRVMQRRGVLGVGASQEPEIRGRSERAVDARSHASSKIHPCRRTGSRRHHGGSYTRHKLDEKI